MTGPCNECGVLAIRRRVHCKLADVTLMLCAACFYTHTDSHAAEG